MRNLAGEKVEWCNKEVLLELERANIAAIKHLEPSKGEVSTHFSGQLSINGATVTFGRAWYYWCVHSNQPLPFQQAAQLNKLYKGDVRVKGYAGGLEPDVNDAWKPGEDVFDWHVDTQAGLNALAEQLVQFLVGQNFSS